MMSEADALRQIATAIGTPAHVDPLADLPGLVMMVQLMARVVEERAQSLPIAVAVAVADAVAAERMAAGTWIRNLTGSGSLAGLARSIEHGDHINDDAPPLPSLRMVMLARDEAWRQVETLTAERGHFRSVAKGRCERIDELHAELDKRVAPHCQHAMDPGHDMLGHGVHPDRVGPSVLDAEIERLTVERDRRIDPVEYAKAVMDGWSGWWVVNNGMPNNAQAVHRAWLESPERVTLLDRVGPDVLAEVER